MADLGQAATEERADWLADILASLVANGVRLDEIDVVEEIENRTVVLVRGVPSYVWAVRFE